MTAVRWSATGGQDIATVVVGESAYNFANGIVHDVPYDIAKVLGAMPPGAPAVAAGAAGLPNGTYRCQVTFVTAAGETSGGTEATVVVVNQQIAWSAIPTGPIGTMQRKLYRTVAGGASGTERLAGTLADNTTTVFSDLASVAAAAAVPTTNTSGKLAALSSTAGIAIGTVASEV